MKIFLRTDNHSSINFNELQKIGRYKVSPAQHMNLYYVDSTGYTDSGYLSVFLYEQNQGPSKLPDSFEAISQYARSKRYVHFIILNDTNADDIQEIKLQGTAKREEKLEGEDTERGIIIDNTNNTPLTEIVPFSTEKVQLFTTAGVKPYLPAGESKFISEVLLGGCFSKFERSITLSYDEFCELRKKYTIKAKELDKGLMEQELIQLLSSLQQHSVPKSTIKRTNLHEVYGLCNEPKQKRVPQSTTNSNSKPNFLRSMKDVRKLSLNKNKSLLFNNSPQEATPSSEEIASVTVWKNAK